MTDIRALLTRAGEVLEPFANFANPKTIDEDFVITKGSPMARRQLTMGDCLRARALHAEITAALARHASEADPLADEPQENWADVKKGTALGYGPNDPRGQPAPDDGWRDINARLSLVEKVAHEPFDFTHLVRRLERLEAIALKPSPLPPAERKE